MEFVLDRQAPIIFQPIVSHFAQLFSWKEKKMH